MTDGPAQRLQLAAAVLRQHGDPAVLAVADALDAHLAGLAELEEALGLKAEPGRRRPATQQRYETRDHWLRVAAGRLQVPQREQAAALAVALARYAGGAWQRERALPDCPARRAGSVEEALWRALHAVERTVGERQVREILQNENGSERRF